MTPPCPLPSPWATTGWKTSITAAGVSTMPIHSPADPEDRGMKKRSIFAVEVSLPVMAFPSVPFALFLSCVAFTLRVTGGVEPELDEAEPNIPII